MEFNEYKYRSAYKQFKHEEIRDAEHKIIIFRPIMVHMMVGY